MGCRHHSRFEAMIVLDRLHAPGASAARDLAIALAVGLAASVVVTACFAPWLVAIRAGFRWPDLFFNVEAGRGLVVLWQTEHLGEPVPGLNAVMRWRLLFPAAAAVLRLPAFVHLAAYPLGAVLAAAFCSHVIARHDARPAARMLGTLAFTANHWFFTSIGWLGYADGWVALGLLVIAFSAQRWPAVTASLLLPWADDRFTLGAPLAIAVRLLANGGGPLTRLSFREAVTLGAGPAIAVASRAILEAFPATASAGRLEPLRGTLPLYAFGAWETWRAVWLAVGVAVAAMISRQRNAGVVATGSGLIMFATALLAANDLSRAGVTLAPLVVAGLLAMLVWQRGLLAVAALALANLLLPATHVIVGLQMPIHSLASEWRALEQPPAIYRPRTYAARAVQAATKADWAQAAQELQRGQRLGPTDGDVVRATATVHWLRGARDTAIGVLKRRSVAVPDDAESRDLLTRFLQAGDQ
jgi:hypothetical protein